MDVFETLEAELRDQITYSKAREESEINQQLEFVEFTDWTEGYYEGYRSGIEYALSRILHHKTQHQIKTELHDSGV